MTAPLVFVDTPVLLRTADDRDPDRQARAREWLRWCWTQRAGRISTQVLNELYHNAITRFRSVMPVQQARAQVRNLRQWQPPHLQRFSQAVRAPLSSRFDKAATARTARWKQKIQYSLP